MTPEERILLKETRANMYEIKNELKDIKAILVGDEYQHAKGVVLMLKDHDERIEKLEKLKDRATWTILGLSVPSGYGVIEFFRKVFLSE